MLCWYLNKRLSTYTHPHTHTHTYIHTCTYIHVHRVPTFNSCTKCVGSLDIKHDRTPDCHTVSSHGCMDDLTSERSFNSQATGVIDVLGLSFDMGVCATRHWQTPGRLVQELNVCTVHTYIHTFIHTYINTYKHTYIPTYIHTYIRIHVRTYVHMYVCVCVNIGTCNIELQISNLTF